VSRSTASSAARDRAPLRVRKPSSPRAKPHARRPRLRTLDEPPAATQGLTDQRSAHAQPVSHSPSFGLSGRSRSHWRAEARTLREGSCCVAQAFVSAEAPSGPPPSGASVDRSREGPYRSRGPGTALSGLLPRTSGAPRDDPSRQSRRGPRAGRPPRRVPPSNRRSLDQPTSFDHVWGHVTGSS
jgi:hypothetical protein